MSSVFIGFMLVLDAVILVVTIYFTWRQGRTWQELTTSENLPPEDHRYFRNQVWRRLAGCLLLVFAAALHSGWFALGLDDIVNQLLLEGEKARAEGVEAVLTDERRRAIYVCSLYVIFNLIVVLGLLVLAALDLWATRGYALRHQNKINADRRAMLQRQVERLRQERNGPG